MRSCPPHLHTREDEFSIVLEGEIGFRSEDQEVVLGAGGYIVKPHGEVHAMWNAGKTPARMIEIISPPGFEGFFRELSEMTAAAGFEPSSVAALGDRIRPSVRAARLAGGRHRPVRPDPDATGLKGRTVERRPPPLRPGLLVH